MPVSVASTTKEYLLVPVTEDGATPNPAYGVEIAILVVGAKEEPESGDWVIAAWFGSSVRILIGPGTSFVLSNGYYDVWVRITTPSEIPVRRAGRIRVT